jgi:hypothetical protein
MATLLILDGQTIADSFSSLMMHQVAEFGMAEATLELTQTTSEEETPQSWPNTPWLSSIKEWLENDTGSVHATSSTASS